MVADPAMVATARELLARLGVTVADLGESDADVGEPGGGLSGVPTVGEYLPRVIAAVGPGARRTYGSYWVRMAEVWGTRCLDEVAASDVEALQRRITGTARYRRTSRGGRHAGEHVVAAARAVYTRAIADGLIGPGASPAHRVVKLLADVKKSLLTDS